MPGLWVRSRLLSLEGVRPIHLTDCALYGPNDSYPFSILRDSKASVPVRRRHLRLPLIPQYACV